MAKKAKKYSIDIDGIPSSLSDFEREHSAYSTFVVEKTDKIIINIQQKSKTGIINCFISGGQVSFSIQGHPHLRSICESCKEYLIENLAIPAADKKSFTVKNIATEDFDAFIELLRGADDIEIIELGIDAKAPIRNRYHLKGKYNAEISLILYNNGTLCLQGVVSSFFLDTISEILHALPNYPKEAIDDFLAIKPTTIHVIDTNLGAHISKIELIEGTIIADWISTSVALINAGIPVEDYGSYTFGVFKALDALISKRLLEDAPDFKDYGTYFQKENGGPYKFVDGVGTYDDNPNLKRALESGYDFFNKNRHTTFHIDRNNIETSRVLSYDEAINLTKEALVVINRICNNW